ncbi:hypothetical protein B0O80DRAFT_421715 [Mortierella sp. GBAus27b]|nr:hypothetical protein B0O80DRAFT_421715 [Mortierella sp. GBAus27b]
MLPSIHHLLDSEPSPGQSDNAPTSHSSPSLVPSTDHHKLPGHSQSDLTMAIEVPLPQRNEPQFRQTQHYPHPPYEPLAPPHLYPQEHDHNGEPLSKTAPVPRLSFSYQSHSSRRHINKNGYTKDFDRYYQPTPIDTTMSSPIDTDPTRKAGSPLSPRIRSRNSEYADMPSDPYAPGPLAPAWPSRSSQDSKPVSPYRSHRRGSPFDPSGSSSSSSTSPSPSISTATAASTPLTTEGISAVTKGTASATINDTRSKYGPGQPRGRGAIRGDYKELTSDRYAASLDYPDRTDTPFKDIGGLVQPAPNDAHSSSPYSRSNSQEMGSYRYESQQSPQLHPNEPNMNGSTNGTRRYSPDMYHKHPSHQARLISTSPPELRYSSLHDSRIPATHVHSSAPSSPSQRSNGSAHEISSRGTERVGDPSGEYYRDDRRHMDTEQDLYRQEQGRRYGSLSSPGPGSVNTLQLSMNPPPRQSNSTSHPSHHQSHPSLHQEQHSPPLHDPVRESDHRTFQQSTNQSSAHLSSHVRQPEHEQASRLSHRQRFVSANGVPFESRQPGFDQQRSTTGSTRIASPTSSHPYHGFSHPRSHSQSTNGKEYRDFKDQGPPSNHPRNLAFSSMSPEDKHPNSAMLNHRRHASQGYDRTGHVEAQGPGSDSHLESRGTRHGGWSHGSSDYDSARLEEEEACQTRPSSMASVHWREERRIIRLSVSESDLHAIDPDSRRGRHAREYPEDDVDEDVEDLGPRNTSRAPMNMSMNRSMPGMAHAIRKTAWSHQVTVVLTTLMKARPCTDTPGTIQFLKATYRMVHNTLSHIRHDHTNILMDISIQGDISNTQ